MDERTQVGPERTSVSVAVASGVGVVAVRVGGDRVGEFGLEHRCAARDVAAVRDGLAVATPEDVVLLDGDDAPATDFGPAVAVGAAGGTVVAADPSGRVARRDDGWTDCGRVDDPVRAADGDLIGAADGVYRWTDGLANLGLSGVRDVAAAGFAATADGVYRREAGSWRLERAGDASVVAARDGRAHAVVDGTLCERTDDGWVDRDLPTGERVAAVAHGPATYAVTGRGTFLTDAGAGWRTRTLGVPEVTAAAVRGPDA